LEEYLKEIVPVAIRFLRIEYIGVTNGREGFKILLSNLWVAHKTRKGGDNSYICRMSVETGEKM
jgi:hypothetical protein